MFGFNGQYPGPLHRGDARVDGHGAPQERSCRCRQRCTGTAFGWTTAIDGVPDAAHPAVEPGQTFTYQLRFPDEGLFWYHPHVREDIQQDLGLYGNIFVSPAGDAARRRVRATSS